jgi:hypothetical protein
MKVARQTRIPRVPTKALATALVKGLVAQASALSGLKHSGTKGTLRETLLGEILQRFLPIHYGIGTGIVVNEAGIQSSQIDLVVFDRRVVPPFVRTGASDVYPWQSVVATIEVKSKLTTAKLRDAEANAMRLSREVFRQSGRALHSIFAFRGTMPRELSDEVRGREFLNRNFRYLSGLCIAERVSWLNVDGGWTPCWADPENCEETKRYIALLVDNVTTMGERNWSERVSAHQSWLGAYIRE